MGIDCTFNIVDEHNTEERKAREVLKTPEGLGIASAEFDHRFTEFQKSVDEHVESEVSLICSGSGHNPAAGLNLIGQTLRHRPGDPMLIRNERGIR